MRVIASSQTAGSALRARACRSRATRCVCLLFFLLPPFLSFLCALSAAVRVCWVQQREFVCVGYSNGSSCVLGTATGATGYKYLNTYFYNAQYNLIALHPVLRSSWITYRNHVPCSDTHTHTHTNMYIYTCMYVYTYVHTCCVLTNTPIPSSRCNHFVVLRPV
jgi:hypothetical protein